MMNQKLFSMIDEMPLVAILRGITSAEAVPVAVALWENGFRFMEVTLNSPDCFESIKAIRSALGDEIVLGAGTVLKPDEVDQVQAAGGQVIISPNMSPDVIRRTGELGLISVPGCFTPTECFEALSHGADMLKIFPADILGAGFIKAVRAVLPPETRICPTGGIDPNNMGIFLEAGATAMGMGSALYKPGKSPDAVGRSAAEFVAAYRSLTD